MTHCYQKRNKHKIEYANFKAGSPSTFYSTCNIFIAFFGHHGCRFGWLHALVKTQSTINLLASVSRTSVFICYFLINFKSSICWPPKLTTIGLLLDDHVFKSKTAFGGGVVVVVVVVAVVVVSDWIFFSISISKN